MKEIITVEIKTQKIDLLKCRTDLLVAGYFSDSTALDKPIAELDKLLDGAIDRVIKIGDFKGKEKSAAVVYGNEKIGAKRIMLVGLGEKKKATLDTLRKASAYLANKAVAMKVENMSLALHNAFGARFDLETVAKVVAEGIYFGSYRYDEYVTDTENGRLGSLNVSLIEPDAAKIKKLEKGLIPGIIIGQAQSYARTISNRPPNVINPAAIADLAKRMAKEAAGIECTIFDEKELAAKGMGGILAVGAGSKNTPRLIILKYTPADKSAKNLPTVAIVGKAITFDSGGISIKPSANMDQMKLDKSGGISVLATMKAISQLQLGINVYGLIPSAENLPSGSSYRPGDILTTFSGKTIEIENTDAEGRLILCDALAYAAKQDCEMIIDIATLTGACMVALGKYKAGLMGNDDKLIKQLQAAADASGEKVWHLPSGGEYLDDMKSRIADLKNTGGRWGGASTAASFLEQFIQDKKWAHLDIAGMDMFEKATDISAEGSTGFGVRLLTAFLSNIANQGKK